MKRRDWIVPGHVVGDVIPAVGSIVEHCFMLTVGRETLRAARRFAVNHNREFLREATFSGVELEFVEVSRCVEAEDSARWAVLPPLRHGKKPGLFEYFALYRVVSLTPANFRRSWREHVMESARAEILGSTL